MKRFIVRFFLGITIFLLLLFIGSFFQSMMDGEFERLYGDGDSVEGIKYYRGLGYAIGKNIILPILIIISSIITMWLQSINHRLGRKKKSTLRKEDIQGPFILYLRSFIDDANTGKSTNTLSDVTSEEEALVEVLSDIAPVYAIGDPKDKKSPLGASRLYVSDDEWKSTVEYLAQRAQVVVLRLGSTDSFWWEVKMALGKINKQKILFVIPESDSLDSILVLSRYFLEHNVDMSKMKTSVSRKRFGSISSFIYFNENGEACSSNFIAYRFTSFVLSYANMLRSSLADFRKRFGLVSKPPKVRKLRCLQILIIAYFFIIGAMQMFADSVTLNIARENTIDAFRNDVESVNETLPEDVGLGIVWQSMDMDEECLNMVYCYPEEYFEMYSQEYYDNDEIASSMIKYIPESFVNKINKFNITLAYHIRNSADASQEYVVYISPSRLNELLEYAKSHSSVLDALRSQLKLMEIPFEVEAGITLISAEVKDNNVIYIYNLDNDICIDEDGLSELKNSIIEDLSGNKKFANSIKEEGVHFIYIYQDEEGVVNARFEILPEEL